MSFYTTRSFPVNHPPSTKAGDAICPHDGVGVTLRKLGSVRTCSKLPETALAVFKQVWEAWNGLV